MELKRFFFRVSLVECKLQMSIADRSDYDLVSVLHWKIYLKNLGVKGMTSPLNL